MQVKEGNVSIIEVNLETNKLNKLFQTYVIERPVKRRKSILVFTNQTIDAASNERFSDRLLMPEQCQAIQTILQKDVNNNSCIIVAASNNASLDPTYVNLMIKEYAATAVVISGFTLAAPLINKTVYETAALQNVVMYIPDIKVPVVVTWNIGTVFSIDPNKFKTDCNLAGFFVYGIIAADTLKNYFIDTSVSYEIVNTMDKFDKFYNKLIKAPKIGIDIEASTDSDGSILTIQVCWDDKKAYILPYKCPDTPFLPSEISKIYKKLRKWIKTSHNQMWIGHYIVYDITKFREEFDIDFLPFKIWDTMAGEYFIDENRKFMRSFRFDDGSGGTAPKFKAYALEVVLAYYAGSFPYEEGSIGKAQRAFLNRYGHEEYAEYCAKDALYVFRIQEKQVERARDRGKIYSMYEKAVSVLGNDMIHVFSEMHRTGSLMDLDYLRNTKNYNSEIQKKIRKLNYDLNTRKSVRKTNAILIDKIKSEDNGVSRSLFDGKAWVFNVNEIKSSQTLFFDVLNLRPLRFGKSGRPALDAAFLSYYKSVKEVELLSKIRNTTKLISTYTDPYLELAEKSKDNRIRATTDFTGVTTCRTSSYSPNFQNIPEHSEEAALIKKAFIATKLGLLLKVDFNAHEVRMWGNVARDETIAKAFSLGMDIRRKIRIWHLKNPQNSAKLSDYFNKINWKSLPYEEKLSLSKKTKSSAMRKILKLYVDLEAKGDVHKRNYEFFYGVPAHKVTKVQRQNVKATVFGALYDKAGNTIGLDINKEEADKIINNFNLTDREKSERLEPFKAQGREILDKMFSTFSQGDAWIKKVKKYASKVFMVRSPLGFVRHLSGYYSPIRELQANMSRRGPNSIIQGLSSNLAYTAARVFQVTRDKCRSNGIVLDAYINKSVHDALESEIRNIILLPIVLYYTEHSLTTLVNKKLQKSYGFELYINLEAEFNLGTDLSQMITYNFTETSLKKILNLSIDKAIATGITVDREGIIQTSLIINKKVNKYRLKELKNRRSFIPENRVLLTPDKLPDIVKGLDYDYKNYVTTT